MGTFVTDPHASPGRPTVAPRLPLPRRTSKVSRPYRLARTMPVASLSPAAARVSAPQHGGRSTALRTPSASPDPTRTPGGKGWALMPCTTVFHHTPCVPSQIHNYARLPFRALV